MKTEITPKAGDKVYLAVWNGERYEVDERALHVTRLTRFLDQDDKYYRPDGDHKSIERVVLDRRIDP